MRPPPGPGGVASWSVQPGATFPLMAPTYYHPLPMRV